MGSNGYSTESDTCNAAGNNIDLLPYIDMRGKTVDMFVMGQSSVCVLFSDTTSFCYGLNDQQQLGRPDATTPISIANANYHNFGNSNYAVYFTGELFSFCAILDNGQVR